VGQIFGSYLITKTDDNYIFIIDIDTTKKLLNKRKINNENKRYLNRPEMISLESNQFKDMEKLNKKLNSCGFIIDITGSKTNGMAIVSAIPAVFSNEEEGVKFIKELISNDNIMDGEIINMILEASKYISMSVSDYDDLIKSLSYITNIEEINLQDKIFTKLSEEEFKEKIMN
jgi:DNA mismatch repair ATPase MutL